MSLLPFIYLVPLSSSHVLVKVNKCRCKNTCLDDENIAFHDKGLLMYYGACTVSVSSQEHLHAFYTKMPLIVFCGRHVS